MTQRRKRQKYHLSTNVLADKKSISFLIVKGENDLDWNAHKIRVWFWFSESACGMSCEDLFGNWRTHLASGVIDSIDVDIFHGDDKRVRAKKKLQEIGGYEESVEKRDDFLDAMIAAWVKYEKALDERVEKYGNRAFISRSIPFTCKGIYE